MKTRKLLGACLALALACGSARAQTLPGATAPRIYGSIEAKAWLDAARNRSRAVESRRLAVESARTTLEALENPALFAFRADSGSVRLSFGEDGVPSLLSAVPTLALEAADPWGTTASLSVATEAGLGSAAAEPVLEPSFSVKQPLDRLLDPAASLELLKARAALADAESELAAAEARSDAETLNLLMAWVQASFDAESKRAALSQAERELSEAKTLGTYSPGSAGLARLELGVRSASIALERSSRSLARAAYAVEAATGLSDAHPPAPPAAAGVPVDSLTPDAARAVAKARRSLALEERGFADEWEAGASLSADFSASNQAVAGADRTTARLGAAAEWDSLTLSGGVGWTGGAGGGTFLDFSLSWRPEPNAARDARRMVDELSLESARVAFASALEAAALDLADLHADIADRELEAGQLDASLEMAALEVIQLRAEAAAGFAAGSEVDEAVKLWIQAAAAAEKAAWQRAAADALVAADFTTTEVSE